MLPCFFSNKLGGKCINNYENETVLEGVAEKVNELMGGRPLFNA